MTLYEAILKTEEEAEQERLSLPLSLGRPFEDLKQSTADELAAIWRSGLPQRLVKFSGTSQPYEIAVRAFRLGMRVQRKMDQAASTVLPVNEEGKMLDY